MPPASAALPSSTRPETASRAIRRRPRTGRLLNCADGRPAGGPAGWPVSVPGLWLRHGQGGRAGQVRGPPPAAPTGPAHFVHGAPSPPAAASRQPGKPTGPVHFVHGALRLPSPGPAARPAAAGPSGAAPSMPFRPLPAAAGMPPMFRPCAAPAHGVEYALPQGTRPAASSRPPRAGRRAPAVPAWPARAGMQPSCRFSDRRAQGARLSRGRRCACTRGRARGAPPRGPRICSSAARPAPALASAPFPARGSGFLPRGPAAPSRSTPLPGCRRITEAEMRLDLGQAWQVPSRLAWPGPAGGRRRGPFGLSAPTGRARRTQEARPWERRRGAGCPCPDPGPPSCPPGRCHVRPGS